MSLKRKAGEEPKSHDLNAWFKAAPKVKASPEPIPTRYSGAIAEVPRQSSKDDEQQQLSLAISLV